MSGTFDDRHLLASALFALALSAAAFAAAAVWLAMRPMDGVAAICGLQAPHCGWCLAAAAAIAAALVASAAAVSLLQKPDPAGLHLLI